MTDFASIGRSARCNVAVDPGDPALPVIGTGGFAAVRKSKTSKWRAGVLIGVHALIAAHIAHFVTAGRTLSPVEPSESAYTIELGYVKAGFIFFAVALLGTMIFGRFFCGWGCHIVALQDLCAWIMKKLGIRPRAFRSRFLAFLPLAVALYMFAWPTLRRLMFGNPPGPFQGLTNQLMTSSFWQSFPGPTIAALTFLTCGFAAVYLLGAKGFCTYGCPYGAMFGPIDTLSIGRIVVSDACEQCGHCTATCTSNVRVHEEVKLYGMVVDSGCMKCMDCVSVCPKGALSFAFAKPSLFKRRPSAPRAKRYDLPLAEEVVLAAICLPAMMTFFRLYDGPPLLMSAALAGLTAFVSLELWHLVRKSNVRIQNVVLKSTGKMQGRGWVFVALALVWLGFTAHSAFVQWHRAWGLYDLNRTEATRPDVLNGVFLRQRYSSKHYRAAAEALRHLSLADSWGIVDVMEIKLGLSWAYMLQNQHGAAVAQARKAVALSPDPRLAMQNLFEIFLASHRIPEAIETMQRKLDLGKPLAVDRFQLAGLLAGSGRLEEAVHEYRECISMVPDSVEAHYNLGDVLRRLGRYDEAIENLHAASRISPGDAVTHVQIGLTYLAQGSNEEALRSLERALELEPGMPESPVPVRQLIEQLERSGKQKASLARR